MLRTQRKGKEAAFAARSHFNPPLCSKASRERHLRTRRSSQSAGSASQTLRSQQRERKGEGPLLPAAPPQPLTGLLGLLGELLRALRAVGHWVTERSVLLAGVRVLPGRVVRNLNLAKARKHGGKNPASGMKKSGPSGFLQDRFALTPGPAAAEGNQAGLRLRAEERSPGKHSPPLLLPASPRALPSTALQRHCRLNPHHSPGETSDPPLMGPTPIPEVTKPRRTRRRAQRCQPPVWSLSPFHCEPGMARGLSRELPCDVGAETILCLIGARVHPVL